jgi:hypothetical protein
MEENVDSIKESNNSDDKLLKKDQIGDVSPKETSSSISKNQQVTNKEEIGNKTSNNMVKDPNKQTVGEENSKPLNIKPKKELPIEKKPFNEFINDHLLPSLIQEFKVRGFEIADINLKNTSRPIAGDKCWVIFCEIKDICNFWLSFEKEDISSLKSISLCKSDQKPSVIESFLIDEKRITLKLIISRILQRLNGQKLIGIN